MIHFIAQVLYLTVQLNVLIGFTCAVTLKFCLIILFQIEFIAIRGTGVASDIAIDAIRITDGACFRELCSFKDEFSNSFVN